MCIRDSPYAGMIILINKNITILRENTLIPGRLLNFEICSQGRKYKITALYGYTGNNATAGKIQNMIDLISECHSRSDNNIILGDFNFVENDLDRVSESRLGKNRTDASLSIPWAQFTNQLDISDPFRVRNPRRRMFSYIHTQNKAKSRIDRVYVNEEECQNIINYKHVTNPFHHGAQNGNFHSKSRFTRRSRLLEDEHVYNY